MGTEVAISFSSLRAQLENERSSLFKIDENIKKIVQTSGRFPNDRFSGGEYARGGARLGAGARGPYPEPGKGDDVFAKRKHETKTVFSRLSARTQDSDGEEDAPGGEGPGLKRARVPSAVSRELPTRAAVLRAQGGDATARSRNRRIFGSLLGTLHKFKQEELVLQTKEEKKAQVERKIEEQARQEKEREQKERKTLFAEREHKKATIKALEAKMARLHEFERWEAAQRPRAGHILTRARPHVYWLPKVMTDKADEKLTSSRKYHEKCLAKKRLELQDELQRIEQRCLRTRMPGAKENDPQDPGRGLGGGHGGESPGGRRGESPDGPGQTDDTGRKRDKFAMDVDERDESEGEERHDDEKEEVKNEEVKEEKESDSSKLDSSVEPNTTTEVEPKTTEEPQPEPKDTDTSNENQVDATESQEASTDAQPEEHS